MMINLNEPFCGVSFLFPHIFLFLSNVLHYNDQVSSVEQAPPRSRGPSVRAFVSNPEPIRVPCHEDLINGSSLSVCVRLWMRSGLAMMIESDFYATDAGRQHFADQLKVSARLLNNATPCASCFSHRD